MGGFWRDLKQSFRSLRRDPGFSAIVILTLALGIGGNTAVFSVAEATFFGRLPFADSDRVLRLQASYRRPDGSKTPDAIVITHYNDQQHKTDSQ